MRKKPGPKPKPKVEIQCPSCGKLTFNKKFCSYKCSHEPLKGVKRAKEVKEKISSTQRLNWSDKTKETNANRIAILNDNNLRNNGYQPEPIPPVPETDYFGVDEHRVVAGGDYWVEDGF